MRAWWRSIGVKPRSAAATVEDVRRAERAYSKFTDEQLDEAVAQAVALPQLVALTAVLVSRVLGLDLFDVQLQAALALADGKIVEMQTGEGKTVAAVPAIAWFARSGQGVHVLTANDYLARRDAAWMGGIYRRLGLSVGVVQQHMTSAERRAAYAMRHHLRHRQRGRLRLPARSAGARCERAGAASVARRGAGRGGFGADRRSAHSAGDRRRRRRTPATWPRAPIGAVRRLTPWDRSIDESGRNVALTPSGLAAVEAPPRL